MNDKKLLSILANADTRVKRILNNMIMRLAQVDINYSELPADELFNFKKYPHTQKEVEQIVKEYSKQLEQVIGDATQKAIKQSYIKQAQMISALNLPTDIFAQEFNKGVVKSFRAYRDDVRKGLNLSQRVWNYAQQTKAEFEMAMSQRIENSIARGTSAEALGREIRDMLKRPDEVYRRYHVQRMGTDGKLHDTIEWRRKTVDAEGNVHFTSTDIERVGRGVYRSSRMNALRLAATEINMSYRYADCVQMQSDKFCRGYQISLSNNHPEEDICDELCGKYPKDFVFTGWHPRCYAEGAKVLTNEGWKEFKTLHGDEQLLSLNPETLALEWANILMRQCYRVDGEMIRFYSAFLECVVTPEHEMIYIRDGIVCRKVASDFTSAHGAILTHTSILQPIEDFKKEIIDYHGNVYDVTLDKNAIMYISFNGKCFWGSNCRCSILPIMCSLKERLDYLKLSDAEKENWQPKDGYITSTPAAFQNYCRENADKMRSSLTSGTGAYFIRDNATLIASLVDVNAQDLPTNEQQAQIMPPVQLSAKEIAAQRHAMRTAAQRKDILDRWAARNAALEAASPLNEICERAELTKIAYNDVKALDTPITSEQIVAKIGGGDRTKGSCSSLAFSYIANVNGLDVTDYRGGESLNLFAKYGIIKQIAEKLGGRVLETKSDFKSAVTLLNEMKKDKLYYFTCGKHAAVTRVNDRGIYEYLELQTTDDNGWKKITKNELKYRFGAQKSHTFQGMKFNVASILIEASLFRRDKGTRKLLGYLNTATNAQQKGAGGTAK